MYAITGITGKVGGELARTLLAARQPVRGIVRDAKKGEEWAALGCELAVAEMEDASALTGAFGGATAVFILPPSEFDPEPGYPEAQAVIDSVVEALKVAKPKKVLCLSTIGADATYDNLLSQRTLMEAALRELPLPLTILRPAWFLDNAAWDVASARENVADYPALTTQQYANGPSRPCRRTSSTSTSFSSSMFGNPQGWRYHSPVSRFSDCRVPLVRIGTGEDASQAHDVSPRFT